MNYSKQTLNQLLSEMDGFAESTGVIVVGATNLAHTLDPALVRFAPARHLVWFPLAHIATIAPLHNTTLFVPYSQAWTF